MCAYLRFPLYFAAEDGDHLFLSCSQDQTINLWRLTFENNDNLTSNGHVTLLHQCKGHARSVEALDVCSDRSKVCLSVEECSEIRAVVGVLFTYCSVLLYE